MSLSSPQLLLVSLNHIFLISGHLCNFYWQEYVNITARIDWPRWCCFKVARDFSSHPRGHVECDFIPGLLSICNSLLYAIQRATTAFQIGVIRVDGFWTEVRNRFRARSHQMRIPRMLFLSSVQWPIWIGWILFIIMMLAPYYYLFVKFWILIF